MQQYYVKKCFLQEYLNTLREVAERTEEGSSFHSRGKETKTELKNEFV